jgi:hypothetical protein
MTSLIITYMIMHKIKHSNHDENIKIHWRNVMLYDTLYFINGNFVTEKNEIVYWHESEERLAVDYLHKIIAKHNISR